MLVASLLNTFLGLSRTSELVLHSVCVGVGPGEAGRVYTIMTEILTFVRMTRENVRMTKGVLTFVRMTRGQK